MTTPALDGDLNRLHVSDSPDFLALVPYLIGYRPAERLVFVVLERSRIVVTGAMPLDALEQPEQARTSFLSAVDQFPDAMVFLACWSDNPELADEALALAEVWLGVERVLDSVSVQSERWHSRWGAGAGMSGSTAELANAPVVAQAVVAGLVAFDSREDAVALVAGPGSAHSPRLEGLHLDVEDTLRRTTWSECDDQALTLHRALGSRLGPAGGDLEPQDLARLAVLSDEAMTREQLFLAMGRGNAGVGERLWQAVVAQTPDQWAGGPLLVLGFAAWLGGNGAILVACIERCLALGVQSPHLLLLEQLNREATPPALWEDVRTRYFTVGGPAGGGAVQ